MISAAKFIGRYAVNVNGVVTTYTQGLAAPLPIVLQAKAGANTTRYLYSLGTRPLAQNSTAWEYLLPDALGSVRQIADANGNVTLAESYEPYGSVLASTGTASSIFGFSGEQIDTYIKLLFLRARYYSPDTARFLSKDVWQGDYTRPQSLDAWAYVENRPVIETDPSGYIAQGEEKGADNIRADLQNNYAVIIPKDYGIGPNYTGAGLCGTKWYDGAWRSLHELTLVQEGVEALETEMGSPSKFESAMRSSVKISRWSTSISLVRGWSPPPELGLSDIVMPDSFFANDDYARYSTVHELGHVWDRRTGLQLSAGLSKFIGTIRCEIMYCTFDVRFGKEAPPGNVRVAVGHPEDWAQEYAANSAMEDWAESLASVVYPNYYAGGSLIGPLRTQYVRDQIRAIP